MAPVACSVGGWTCRFTVL
uniref:Uncharacterized protein n=1 Tax=Arundo donax TaxID=35708 RepID=A0A0A8Z908_ARUDO